MSTVTGSKQYRSVVVQDRPGLRWIVGLSVLSVLITTAVISYWLGGHAIVADHGQLMQDYQQLQKVLEETKTQLAETSQRLANQSLGSEVDRQAVEEIRAVVREHKQKIIQLKEEISFYKGLMAPTERERGLGIRGWEVYPTADPERYQFKLVMQQLAVKHAMLSGTVTVTLVGRQSGVEQSYTLDMLSEQVDKKEIRLRFKYFQYIDGELQLPKDFVVDRVDIVAQAGKPNDAKIEKHYGWVVQVENS